MPRRNRVLPTGDLAAVDLTGAWMGNRGCLHDGAGTVVRRQSSYRGWVTCRLSFRDRRVPLAAPGSYTPLFFLDEVTAFAAGHRPCGECRRADYRAFAAAWERVGLGDARATAIDARLHADRLEDGRQRVATMAAAALPDGAMVTLDGADSWLVDGGGLHRWTAGGYVERVDCPAGDVAVRTPAAIVAVLTAGYRAQTQLDRV